MNNFIDHKYFMSLAIDAANNDDEVPVGCVIIHEGKVVASSCNKVEELKNPLLHAEILAINEAVKKLDVKFLCDCIMFCTLEPCKMCINAINLVRMKRVIFGAYNNGSISHESEIIGGVCEDKCKNMLYDFFKPKRNK
ncbi:nucleoside deaminase [Candidatus Cytomitobacter indipagum]|uniref:Nucleoside deaminase n=1 Tax=Candidatus Cytomitobacter indipagum TaxID=2601575 RepID=A0A5C0UFQ1_9PROT|nr:nucleoside deaminase [Candidatus Cytomitobacter indipagum]QEK38082.1 nucleoside deaminase [Candidatus Cytomitobacter indipagum]